MPRNKRTPHVNGCPIAGCREQNAISRDGRLRGGDQQYVCMTCGTRFIPTRVLFSFDEHESYAGWRTLENRERLAAMRTRVTDVVRQFELDGRQVTLEPVFREAGIPSVAPYLTPRAGLAAIVTEAARRKAA